ncbi:MAG: DUF4169 family protein [Brevundimonas sp.]|uniref:DUF4169 family protein n=1 Tax=Brevundimonas sp. TaxID=1871086 RepID=UPI0028D32C1F|nr:DUF4169 family protein [uncultured Brevundimonas sp.]
MGDVVNLNRIKKTRAKAEQKAGAAANRILHGRTKAEKQAAELERARADRLLNGARRDAPPADD